MRPHGRVSGCVAPTGLRSWFACGPMLAPRAIFCCPLRELLLMASRQREEGWWRTIPARDGGPFECYSLTQMHGLMLVKPVAVAMLILANAFFVAAEFALVSIRDTRVEQLLADGVPGARAVRRLQRELDDFLPAVQLGVTLCSLALGWIGEPLAAALIFDWLSIIPLTESHALLYAHIIAVTVGFAIITYLHVLVGELVPKSLALRRAEALAVAVAPAMLIFIAVARPAVRFLKGSAAVILRGFDIELSE